MRKQINQIYHRILVILHLSPLSLAEKVRITFGAAVLLVLALALSIPYVWMGQLTKKASLDAGRARSEALFDKHFRLEESGGAAPAPLSNTGAVLDVNHPEMRWIRFTEEQQGQLAQLPAKEREIIELLRGDSTRDEDITQVEKNGAVYNNYFRVFRAGEACLSCHNPQGSATAFDRDEAIGAVVIERPAGEISKTILMNRVWIIVAFLIAGTGAIIAFYMITQRVILRPIRQLRAIANNVAEGNLDIRSTIKTRDEYEKLAGAFNHMLDELQRGQEKLRQANRQLDAKIAELSERNIELFRANKVKSEFLANISHEFRTPLNAILGFAEILRDKPGVLKKEKGQRYAENIITSGKNLLNMINDLLDLAKTEAGKMELHLEQTNVVSLCEAVVASFSQMTKNKKIKVRLNIDEDIPELRTDPGKVQQILYNFVSNAVKFTAERGRIEVGASMSDPRHVRIWVSDTGCGIAEADQEKIFEKFRQADGSLTRQSTGTGLGLAISKELAAMLAGSIGLESELNKGSTFWLEIPVTLTKDQDGDHPSRQ